MFVLTPLFCLSCLFSVSVKWLLVSKQKYFEISVLQNDLRFKGFVLIQSSSNHGSVRVPSRFRIHPTPGRI